MNRTKTINIMKTNPQDQVIGFFTPESGTVKGLTKREHFASMAMQGLISHYGVQYQSDHFKEAVYFADELIEQLNKEK